MSDISINYKSTIHNRVEASRIIDFKLLRYASYKVVDGARVKTVSTPSDIDMFVNAFDGEVSSIQMAMELKKETILAEFKKGSTPIPRGQEFLYRNFGNEMSQRSKDKTIRSIRVEWAPDRNTNNLGDIIAATCQVTHESLNGGQFNELAPTISLKLYLDRAMVATGRFTPEDIVDSKNYKEVFGLATDKVDLWAE